MLDLEKGQKLVVLALADPLPVAPHASLVLRLVRMEALRNAAGMSVNLGQPPRVLAALLREELLRFLLPNADGGNLLLAAVVEPAQELQHRSDLRGQREASAGDVLQLQDRDPSGVPLCLGHGVLAHPRRPRLGRHRNGGRAQLGARPHLQQLDARGLVLQALKESRPEVPLAQRAREALLRLLRGRAPTGVSRASAVAEEKEGECGEEAHRRSHDAEAPLRSLDNRS
mmetsp:Transcript_99562/g.259577  ORF Transcript_99562/g.259577 Transcript_99562/m.259577 type:complete len:228 (+) Transcript_99562:818-1501(+)